jgi:hypothetical protein
MQAIHEAQARSRGALLTGSAWRQPMGLLGVIVLTIVPLAKSRIAEDLKARVARAKLQRG